MLQACVRILIDGIDYNRGTRVRISRVEVLISPEQCKFALL